MKSIIAFFVAVYSLASGSGPQENVAIEGSCPAVPFIENFNSERFLGKWYGVRESKPVVACSNYEIAETRPNHYHGLVWPLNVTYEFDKINPKDFSEGMRITFKENPYMDGGDLRVFSTDYENFAGTFICKETEGAHYQTISYWSRSKTLTTDQLAGLDGFLAKYERTNTSLMRDIEQEACVIT